MGRAVGTPAGYSGCRPCDRVFELGISSAKDSRHSEAGVEFVRTLPDGARQVQTAGAARLDAQTGAGPWESS